MFALVLLTALAALLFIYLFMPALWFSFAAADDHLASHEAGLVHVASRNPFRETGPPANMAKLILLRHKIQTSNRRRRSSSHARQAARHPSPAPRPKAPWIYVGRPIGSMSHH